jgi:hypothetical protein
MTIDDLVRKGYFLKELPPPFSTIQFADHLTDILTDWEVIFRNNTSISSNTFVLLRNIAESNNDFKARKSKHASDFTSKYGSSKCIVFSISKGKYTRRFLQIPNPKHFALLAKKVSDLWIDINGVYKLSPYSASYPVLNPATNGRAVKTFSSGVAAFQTGLLEISRSKMIEVRLDIAKFYPSIYTHAIVWALIGKEKAKHYFRHKNNLEAYITAGDPEAILYKKGEQIDNTLRACQERQSVGFPVGPDTSHILSEVITSRIDQLISSKFGGIGLKASRFYDDYYFYVSTKDEADQIIKGVQLILSDFQLEINEGKVEINEFPFSFEQQFTLELFLFKFKITNLEYSLKHYFSMIWGFAEKSPMKADWIFKYALRTFEYRSIEIPKRNWKLFEDLLFKTCLIEPSILEIMVRILLSYSIFIDVGTFTKLKELVNVIIHEHSPLKHNFEMSWALWLAKSFSIEIDESTANKIIESRDNVSNLILLDMANNTELVMGAPNFAVIENELKDDVLFSENWLLAYEGVKKGWLIPAEADLLDNNLFFKLMKDSDVEFYNAANQLPTYSATRQTVDGHLAVVVSPALPTTYDGAVTNNEIVIVKPSDVLGGY